MTLSKTILRVVSLSIAFAIAGCANVSPIAQAANVEGRAVSLTALRVVKPFQFRPALYSATFPAGVYLPSFEDSEGFYFRAPSQVLTSTLLGGGVANGGIYVSRASWGKYRAYITDGSIYKFDIDVPVEITLVDAP